MTHHRKAFDFREWPRKFLNLRIPRPSIFIHTTAWVKFTTLHHTVLRNRHEYSKFHDFSTRLALIWLTFCGFEFTRLILLFHNSVSKFKRSCLKTFLLVRNFNISANRTQKHRRLIFFRLQKISVILSFVQIIFLSASKHNFLPKPNFINCNFWFETPFPCLRLLENWKIEKRKIWHDTSRNDFVNQIFS